MEKYFKLKKQLEDAQNDLNSKLKEVLDKNGYDDVFAWFKFSEDELVMIWDDTQLPRQMIDDLEEAFGKIDYIHIINNPLSQKMFIKFGGE